MRPGFKRKPASQHDETTTGIEPRGGFTSVEVPLGSKFQAPEGRQLISY